MRLLAPLSFYTALTRTRARTQAVTEVEGVHYIQPLIPPVLYPWQKV